VQQGLEARPEIKGDGCACEAGGSWLSPSPGPDWWPQISLTETIITRNPNQRFQPAQIAWNNTLGVGNVSLDMEGDNVHQTDQPRPARTDEGTRPARCDGVTLDITQAYLTLETGPRRVAVAETGGGPRGRKTTG